jgi:ADP-ribose pyrophosphatase
VKKKVYTNPYFNVVNEGKYFYIDYNRPHSGVVIILQLNDKILFTHSYRFPIKKYQWELPRGFIDKGETPLEAAKRELKEETGYNLTKGKLIGYIAPDSGGMNNTVPVVLFKTTKEQVLSGDGEVDKYAYVSKKDLKQFIKRHKIIDGFTLSSLFLLE